VTRCRNFNGSLQFLNLSGNKRLEIRPDHKQGHGRHEKANSHEEANLHEFNGLKHLKVLGIMDVTTGFKSNVPDESEECRVRTSGSEVNGMSYGIADSIKRGGTLSMFDLVTPNFRSKETECLVGIFGRPEISHNNAKLSKFIHDNFGFELITQLTALRPELDEGPVQAFRRAFLFLNQRIWNSLGHSSYMGYGRKMSQVSVATNPGTLWTDWQALQAGSSAVVLYISEKTLYIANAGNSLAVLSRRGEAHLLSKRHDPSDQSELNRIREAEGWVSSKGLLGEEVDVSRSFGMFHLAPATIARPDVFEEELTSDDDYIILGNRYLWDYVPYQNAVDIVTKIDDPMIAAQKLRDCAMGYGATESVIVMVLRLADLFATQKTLRRKAEDDIEDAYWVRRRGAEPGVNKLLARLPGEVDAPVGTVALVFTDIRNSTALWEKNAGMSTAMRLHNEMLMRQLMNIGGYLVKTEGDAFMCSFPTVISALLWCFTVQLQLLKLEWPLEILESQDGREIYGSDGKLLARGLSVRMGIHWGPPLCEPDVVTHRMDYLGPVVNRAARISGSAQGGQIMISNVIIQELKRHFAMDETQPPPTPPKDSELEDPDKRREQGHVEAIRRIGHILTPMGEHKLKGIEAPEPLSLIWPSELVGRLHLRGDEGAEVSQATADASSRVPFSITQMKELAMLCIRLETLTSGRVFKDVSSRKVSAATTTSVAALAASVAAATATVAQSPGTVVEVEVDIQQGAEAREVVGRPMSTGSTSGGPTITVEGEEDGASSVYLLANPELLMPTIREGATDDELMLLLDSLSLRIQNATLYLQQRE
jgi:adenylate cyclase